MFYPFTLDAITNNIKIFFTAKVFYDVLIIHRITVMLVYFRLCNDQNLNKIFLNFSFYSRFYEYVN